MKYSPELLRKLYRVMLKIRVFEEHTARLVALDEIQTPCHLYTGQEAIASGLCTALSTADYIAGNHRSHGHFLAKGGSIFELMSEIVCRESGCSRGRGGSMHLTDLPNGFLGSAPIVAGTVSIAVGAALASSIRKDGRISVAFFGDGAVGEGAIFEAMNFASLKKLPIIFACENNFYATHMPLLKCRSNDEIFKIAFPFDISSFRVDGNDVLEVYECSRQAVQYCYSRQGPVFLEFLTYRQHGHVGPDDNILGMHTDIRSQDEIDKWRKRDPIARFEKYLMENKIMSEREFGTYKIHLQDEVEKAYKEASEASMPNTEEVLNYVFRQKAGV